MNEDLTEAGGGRRTISLYEFYAIGINHLLIKAPWELVRAVSEYHGNFLTEQRCLSLAILQLLGESHVPASAYESMPKYEEQVRISVSQATFLRALKHHFAQHGIEAGRAEMVLERMHSYLIDSRQADKDHRDPLDAMGVILLRRVPPKDNKQHQLYVQRVDSIYEYIEKLVNDNLLARYQITG
jgi:hypothetical protein